MSEASSIGKQIRHKMVKVNLNMSFPKSSPYGELQLKSGPSLDQIKNAKKAEFLENLKESNYKFSYDKKENGLTYKNPISSKEPATSTALSALDL